MMALMYWLNQNSGAVTGIAAAVGVLVTAVYAFFTVLLWLATRRQAELTRQIFEATHRPHVSMQPHLRAAAHPGYVKVDFELKNHGSSPAIVTDWSATIRLGQTDLGRSAAMSGSLCVFPGSAQYAPHIELEGTSATAVWRDQPPVVLDVRATYHGVHPIRRYFTAVQARFRVSGTHTLVLEEVQHEVT